MRGRETTVKFIRLAVRVTATVLLSGAVAGGCGAPAGKAAAQAEARQNCARGHQPSLWHGVAAH